MYSVDYIYQDSPCRNSFLYEYEAKHYAVELAYEGLDPLVCEFNKIIGKVQNFGACKAFVYI